MALEHDSRIPGRLVYLPRFLRGNFVSFSIQSVVKETSRASHSLGIQIPTVDENAFRTGTIQFVDVPVSARHRIGLRIYTMNIVDIAVQAGFAVDAMPYLLNIFSMESAMYYTPPDVQLLVFVRSDPHAGLEERPLVPAYFEVGDLSVLIPEISRFESVRITLEPQFPVRVPRSSPVPLSWAMLTLADNADHSLSIRTPE